DPPRALVRRLDEREAAERGLECGEQLLEACPTPGAHEVVPPRTGAALPRSRLVVARGQAPEEEEQVVRELVRVERCVHSVSSAGPGAVPLLRREDAGVDHPCASAEAPKLEPRLSIAHDDDEERARSAVLLLLGSGRERLAVEAGQVAAELRRRPRHLDD